MFIKIQINRTIPLVNIHSTRLYHQTATEAQKLRTLSKTIQLESNRAQIQTYHSNSILGVIILPSHTTKTIANYLIFLY